MSGSPATRPAPELEGRRYALVVATTDYADPVLRGLRSPATDAADLARVLADPTVGAFEVTTVLDPSAQELRDVAHDFLADRGRGDLVVVYVSCHGLTDLRRRLYFAASDTVKARLAATGVESTWLLDRLEECRARRQVVVLDCCFSGAFAQGAKGPGDLDLGDRLTPAGRGRVVLTASTAWEYSFEGGLEGAVGPGETPSTPSGSVFTTALLDGLRSGAADADADGWVTVDEAYDFAYRQVRAVGAAQTPQRWVTGGEGAIVLARNPAGVPVTPGPVAVGSRRAASDSPHERSLTWIRAAPMVLRSDTEGVGGFDGLVDVAFSPDGRLLASTAGDGRVGLWDVSAGVHLRTVTDPGSISGLAFTPDGSLLASSSWDQTVGLWNYETGVQVRALTGHTESVVAVTFAPDGRLLASASWDKTVRLWDPHAAVHLRTLAHMERVLAVAFSPDGRLLASGGDEVTVRLWDPHSGKHLRTLAGHEYSVEAVAFSADRRLLATGSQDETVRLWDPTTGTEVRILTGHTDWLKAVAFSPDGGLLASAGDDQTVRLWNPSTGAHLGTYVHNDHVNAVAFSPDGRLLATGSRDGDVRVWLVR